MLSKLYSKFSCLNFTILLSLLLCSSTCKKDQDCANGHKNITFINISDTSINWVFSTSSTDTFWRTQGINYPDASFGLIHSKSTYVQGAGMEQCWEHQFQNGYSEYFFFFNQDT